MIEYDKIFNTKYFTIPNIFIKELKNKSLSLNEFLLLLYFFNSDIKIFDLVDIKEKLGLDEKEILESFNELTNKKLIGIEVTKNEEGHMLETVSLKGFYQSLNISVNNEKEQIVKENIFDIFEKEFNRALTPMEYEIINAWLDNDTKEELILGALKEAIYNGVKSFRYIDKIIYEWGKKGFKTMDDVKQHINNQYKEKETSKKEELFDYDWLDDDEV